MSTTESHITVIKIYCDYDTPEVSCACYLETTNDSYKAAQYEAEASDWYYDEVEDEALCEYHKRDCEGCGDSLTVEQVNLDWVRCETCDIQEAVDKAIEEGADANR